MLVKLKDSIKNIVYKVIPPPWLNISYSQAGEDCIISFLINQLNIKAISYLEIGVYHPIHASNTYKFYKEGSQGVLIEADPSLITEIKRVRQMDKVLNYGITTTNTNTAKFYVFEEPAHNTFDKEEAEFRVKNGSFQISKVIDVEVKAINDIIKENFGKYPDFLSIDIEGLDYKVLESLNTKAFPIPIICAETCKYSESHIKIKDESIIQLMSQKGYFVYADTYINTIFVNKDWFHSKQK